MRLVGWVFHGGDPRTCTCTHTHAHIHTHAHAHTFTHTHTHRHMLTHLVQPHGGEDEEELDEDGTERQHTPYQAGEHGVHVPGLVRDL